MSQASSSSPPDSIRSPFAVYPGRGGLIETVDPPSPWEGNPASGWDLGGSPAGEPGPMYVMLTRLTNRGRRVMSGFPQRILEVNHEVEQRGCEVIAQYALLGSYDFVTFVRANDNAAMHDLTSAVISHGDLRTRTFPALPAADFVQAMKRGWTPPSLK